MDKKLFADQHVLVTGANGGIGIKTVEEFIKCGAKVTCQCNSSDGNLIALLQRSAVRENVFVFKGDLRDENVVKLMFERAEAKFGGIDVIVVNHAIAVEKNVSVEEMTLGQWNNTIDTNLTSAFLCCREYLRHFRKHRDHDTSSNHTFSNEHGNGSNGNGNRNGNGETRKCNIVMIGSTAGIFGEAYHADYATSKSGMHGGLLLSLKNELKQNGRINVVAPGWVLTSMAEAAVKEDPLVLQRAKQTIALNKVANVTDVVYAILFLASNTLSGHISGHVLQVTGGMEGRVLHPLLNSSL